MKTLSPKQVITYWQTLLNNRHATDGELQEANLMAASHSTNPVVMHCTNYRVCPKSLRLLAQMFSRDINMLLTGPKHRAIFFRYEAQQTLNMIKLWQK